MLTCEKCGASLSGYEQFCNNCGNVVVIRKNNEDKDMEDWDSVLVRNMDDDNLEVKPKEPSKGKKKSLSIKIYLAFLIPVIVALVIIFIDTQKKENKVGNTFHNYIVGAPVAKQGDWIYYSFNGNIYKMRTKDGKPEKVADVDGVHYFDLSVIGEYIYCSGSDGFIYKIGINDKRITKLLDANKVLQDNLNIEGNITIIEAVTDEEIYFSFYAMDRIALYKMELDGSNVQKIVDGYYNIIHMDSRYIYCINYPEIDINYPVDDEIQLEYKIYRFTRDGSESKVIYEDRAAVLLMAWIDNYRLYLVEGDKLYQYDFYSKEKKVILENVEEFNVAVKDGWIYYTQAYDLYKRKVGSNEAIKISDEPVSPNSPFSLFDTHILYNSTIDEDILIKTDGSDKIVIKNPGY